MADKEKRNFKELNHWVGMGRLGSDPLFTQKGDKKIAKFTLAVNNGTDDPDWLDIVCFSHNAEFANNFLEKGVKVVIEGRIASSSYEDRDGIKRKSTNIVARSISISESKRSVESSAEVEAETESSNTDAQTSQPKEDFSIPDDFVPVDDENPFK